MLALADVFDLLLHELTRLRRRTLAFARILPRALDGGLRWHMATPAHAPASACACVVSPSALSPARMRDDKPLRQHGRACHAVMHARARGGARRESDQETKQTSCQHASLARACREAYRSSRDAVGDTCVMRA